MILDFNNFSKATKTVEDIMNSPSNADIETMISASINDVPEGMKRNFYSHMNNLFLNILLNRLSEFEPFAKERAEKSRYYIVKKLNTF